MNNILNLSHLKIVVNYTLPSINTNISKIYIRKYYILYSELLALNAINIPTLGFSFKHFIFMTYFALKLYNNFGQLKEKILEDNKGKSGIYLFTNKINNKKYVGSFINLSNRFIQYFSIYYLKRNVSMYICQALIKYNADNFQLEIIEYCEKDQLVIREQF
jgi:hypothetical protein